MVKYLSVLPLFHKYESKLLPASSIILQLIQIVVSGTRFGLDKEKYQLP